MSNRNPLLTDEPAGPPLSIGARKPLPVDERPIIALCSGPDGPVLATEAGEAIDWDTFVMRLPDYAPAILVTHDSFDALAELDAYWQHHPHWQWTLYPPAREWDDTPTFYGSPNVARFGFARYGQDRRARYLQVLSPGRFSEAAANMLQDGGLAELIGWAAQVRAWCSEQRTGTRSTAASIGTAMLTDRRFEPARRRKVPAATNFRAREQLPGNHYSLLGSPARVYPTVRKLDLSAAHHRAAMQVQFPDPNTLTAKGRWRIDLPADSEPADNWAERPYAWRAPGRKFEKMISEHGLFLVVLRTPEHVSSDPLAHPSLKRAGRTYRYVWSSEISHLRASGATILAIVAQWTSRHVSEQLNEFGMWAIGELDRVPQCREWLKPALLATYGVLAARPRRFRVAYRTAKGGRTVAFPTRRGDMLEGQLYETAEREPRTANVIARGLIEASVRARVLAAARQLRAAGQTILEVWADSIFLDGPGPPSLGLEPAWRDEGTLSNVRFYDSTHVVGDGFVKLPGITGPDRDRIASLEMRERMTAG